MISEALIGTVVNVYLETSNKKQIVVQLQSRELDSLDLSIGLSLYASWHPEDCHLV
ncbi:TOBE domain-containing protein [Herbaspirillum sp. GCM10030257]|uniref:TOBE domain-containing protein n=1 Tax=Herbaspirillum sp. GCM10030257 TaxID=3273393 RepID=UPI0036083E9E